MNNSILSGINVSPLKQNMEDGQFSLIRNIYRRTKDLSIIDVNMNNRTYRDSSSYMERKKAKAIGNKSTFFSVLMLGIKFPTCMRDANAKYLSFSSETKGFRTELNVVV